MSAVQGVFFHFGVGGGAGEGAAVVSRRWEETTPADSRVLVQRRLQRREAERHCEGHSSIFMKFMRKIQKKTCLLRERHTDIMK